MKIPKSLRDHLKKYGYYQRHGRVVKWELQNNLLSQPMFYVAHFKDGFYCTFCPRDKKIAVYNPGWDNSGASWWWRHHGGGRYGRRKMYEGRT
jgi:hypothetical protein